MAELQRVDPAELASTEAVLGAPTVGAAAVGGSGVMDRAVRALLAEEAGLDDRGNPLPKSVALPWALATAAAARFEDRAAEAVLPETLVTTAETAIDAGDTATAAAAVLRFMAGDPPKNQFYCRALLVQARVEHAEAAKLNGKASSQRVVKAVGYLMQVLKIAGDPVRAGEYNFLVYNASVFHWHLIRRLLKPGSWGVASTSLQAMVTALDTAKDPDAAWRVRNLLLLAVVLAENGEGEKAIPHITNAITAAKTVLGATGVSLTEIVRRVGMHIGRSTPKLAEAAKAAAAAGRETLLIQLQAAMSAPLGTPDVYTNLIATLTAVDPVVASLATNPDAPASDSKSEVDTELVAWVGHAAAQHRLWDLAQLCADRVHYGKSSTPKALVIADYAESLILTGRLSSKESKLAPAKAKGAAAGMRGTLRPTMNESKVEAILTNRRVDALKLLDRALLAAKRVGDLSLIEHGCCLVWNAGLPLLQPSLRRQVHRAFSTAADCLESVGSNFLVLRACFHLELARCELATDFIAKALVHLGKGLALDYGGTEAETPGKESAQRFLDRYLQPLASKLQLKSSLYQEPDNPEDAALLLLEQGKDATEKHVAVSLLSRAAVLLDQSSDASTSGAIVGDTAGPRIRYRCQLWADIAQCAWTHRAADLALQAAQNVRVISWDAMASRDMVLQQATMDMIVADATAATIRKTAVAVEDDPSLTGLDIPEVAALGVRVAKCPATTTNAKDEVIAALMSALQRGKSVKATWVVENAALTLWNYHVAVFQNGWYAAVLPSLRAALRTCLDAITELRIPNTDLFSWLSVGLGSLMEAAGERDAAEAVCLAAITFPDVRPIQLKRIIKLLARLRLAKGTAPATLAPDVPGPAAQALVQIEALRAPAVAPDVKAAMLKAAMDSITAYEALQVTLRDTEPAPPPPPAPPAGAKGAKAAGAKGAKAAAAPAAAPVSTGPPVPTNPKQEALYVRDLAEKLALTVELWTRVAQGALLINSLHMAQKCSSKAIALLPDAEADRQAVEAAVWSWWGLAECVSGQASLGLVDTSVQERAVSDSLRRAGLAHFGLAAQWAARAGNASLVTICARHAWNVCSTLGGSAITRAGLLEHVRRTLTAVTTCVPLAANDAAEDELSEPTEDDDDAGIAVPVGPDEDAIARAGLFQVLFDCLADDGSWQAGLAATEDAFSALPSAMHRPIWSARVVFMSKLGQNVAGGLSKMKESSPLLQAKVWASLARSSSRPADQLEAYLNALSTLGGSFARVTALVDYAEWLHANRFPVADVQDQLTVASDIVYDVLFPEEATDDGMDERGEEGRSFVSGVSGAQHRVATSGAPRSVASRSVRSGGVARSVAPSMAQSSAGGPTSRGARTVGRPATVRTGAPGAGSVAASVKAMPADWPRRVEVSHLELLVRLQVMLAQSAGSFPLRLKHALTAQYHVVQMWSMCVDTASSADAAAAFLALPEGQRAAFPNWAAWADSIKRQPRFMPPQTLLDWLTYTPSPELRAVLKDVTSQAINARLAACAPSPASIPNPALTLHYLTWLADCLQEWGYVLHVAPVFCVMNVLAEECVVPPVAPLVPSLKWRTSSWLEQCNQTTASADLVKSCPLAALTEAERREFGEQVALLEESGRAGRGKAGNSVTIAGDEAQTRPFRRREIGEIQVRYLWITLAGFAIRAGNMMVAKSLLSEASRHAKAFGDLDASVQCALGDADIALLEGRFEDAERIVLTAQPPADAPTGSSLPSSDWWLITERVIKSLQGQARVADVNAIAAQAMAAFDAACQPVIQSTAEGVATAADSSADLEAVMAAVRIRVTAAELAVTEAASLRQAGAAWGDAWHNAVTLFRDARMLLETRGGHPYVVTILLAHAAAAQRVLCVDPSVEPATSVTGEGKVIEPLSQRTAAVRIQGLAQVADLLQLAQSTAAAWHASTYMAETPTSWSIPAARAVAAIQARLASLHLELADAKVRAVQAAAASFALVAESDPVAKYLAQTAPKAPIRPVDVELPHAEQAMLCASNALQLCRVVPGIQPAHRAVFGRSILRLAVARGGFSHMWSDAAEAAPTLSEDVENLQKQAEHALRTVLEAGVTAADYSALSLAAAGLADVYGVRRAADTVQFLALWQACEARLYATEILRKAAALDSRLQLFMTLRDQSLSSFLNPTASTAYRTADTVLREQTAAFKLLDLSMQWNQLLTLLPRGVSFVLLQRSADGHRLYAAVFNARDRTPEEVTAQGAGVALNCAVHRVDLTGEERIVLANAAAELANLRIVAPKLLQNYGEDYAWRADVAPTAEAPVPAPDTVDSRVAQVTADVSAVLMRALSGGNVAQMISTSTSVVILPDRLLAGLPLEALPCFTSAQSVTRDFSLYFFANRIALAGEKAATAVMGNLRYVADPRYEDMPRTAEESKSARARRRTMLEVFTDVYNRHGGGKWIGVPGNDHIPSVGEWQAMLRTADSGGLVFLGTGRCLANIPPRSVAGLNAPGCRFALLLDGVSNDASSRRLAKLDNQKTLVERSLELPFEAALLWSLMGVGLVGVHQWATTFRANEYLLISCLNKANSGTPVAQAVREALVQPIQLLPLPGVAPAGPAAAGAKGAKAAPAAGAKGAKGGAAAAGAPAAGIVAPPTAAPIPVPAPEDSNVVGRTFKPRVSFNTVLYGLPHLKIVPQ